MEQSSPFRGLRVVELASVLAGPAVGMFFAELGAEVIKVENPATGGDMTRQWKLPTEDPESKTSAYFSSVNWGKTHLFLDLSAKNDRKELFSLLEKADILLVNFKPGDAERFGVDAATMARQFPKLIYAALSGYGENDPRPAFDLALQAETGFMSMNGTEASGPLKMPVALIDVLAAHQLKEGILTALYLREKTGKGSQVNVSLYDSAIASLANQASNYLVAKHIPQRMGSLHPNIAPYGETFVCKDGRSIVLAVGTDKQFVQLCETSGNPALAKDDRFLTNASRVRNRAALLELLAPFFTGTTAADASFSLQRHGVPHAVIRTVAEALDAPEGKKLMLGDSCVRTAVFRLRSAE